MGRGNDLCVPVMAGCVFLMIKCWSEKNKYNALMEQGALHCISFHLSQSLAVDVDLISIETRTTIYLRTSGGIGKLYFMSFMVCN